MFQMRERGIYIYNVMSMGYSILRGERAYAQELGKRRAQYNRARNGAKQFVKPNLNSRTDAVDGEIVRWTV